MKTYLKICILFGSILIFLSSYREDDTTIKLKWNKAYAGETRDTVTTGLLWSLSLLGAELPLGCKDDGIEWNDSNLITLHLHKMGFAETSLKFLKVLCDSIKISDEYKLTGGIDIGRWIVLTLHSPWHYYKITGTAPTLQEFYNRHSIDSNIFFVVCNSGVAKKPRRIKMEVGSKINDLCFVAEQSNDSNCNVNFTAIEYETFDVMPNSQLRFAIYDRNGNLKDASDTTNSHAGKPGKCMWCHESKVQPLFFRTEETNSNLTLKDFTKMVDSANAIIDTYRKNNLCEINFDNKQDHTLHELLYISFMEPSAGRTSLEWLNFNSDKNLQSLANTQNHIYEEFPFLGKLYWRSTIDSISPFKVMAVPNSVREPSVYEPNYFKNY
ncbi:MAG TPA: hypothetical protein PK736_08310 [Bacteroidia bacterium]|nr:hypothetical protein [Bacteroidia bacterium]